MGHTILAIYLHTVYREAALASVVALYNLHMTLISLLLAGYLCNVYTVSLYHLYNFGAQIYAFAAATAAIVVFVPGMLTSN